MTYNWRKQTQQPLIAARIHVQFSGYILKDKITNQRSVCDFERRDNGITELRRLRRSEGYRICLDEVGVDWGEGPPVPIPNTEVKLTFADNTLRATAREDR